MGDKPVGLATLFGSLLGIALLFSAGFAWDLYGMGSTSHTAKIVFFISLGLVPLAIVLHFFGPRIDRDVYPDVLSELFAGAAIMQMDDCHIVVLPEKFPGGVRFIVCLQNRFDHRIDANFSLAPTTSWQFPNRIPPQLKIEIAPNEVVVAHLWRRFEKTDQDDWFKSRIKGSTKRHQKGRQVRFVRREVLRTEISNWMTILGLFGGGIYFGGHRQIKIRWQKNAPWSDVPDDPDWIVERIWTPMQNQSIEQIATHLQSLQNDTVPTTESDHANH